MSDWGSYDHIARRYDDVWGSRFEVVARHIWALISAVPRPCVLDVGTGTGAVLRAFGARTREFSGVIGCDRSASMLAMARVRMPTLPVVAADVTHLPFRETTFDVATASFVLSHLPDYRAGLAEAHRVLKPQGICAITSWAASTDPYSEAWGQLLAEAVSKDRLQEAVAEILPGESFFESATNVETALREAGFSGIEVHTFDLEWSFSPESYLADRELGSGGRFGRHVLGPEGWDRFMATAREELRRQFGSRFSYSRGFLIGFGRRA